MRHVSHCYEHRNSNMQFENALSSSCPSLPLVSFRNLLCICSLFKVSDLMNKLQHLEEDNTMVYTL